MRPLALWAVLGLAAAALALLLWTALSVGMTPSAAGPPQEASGLRDLGLYQRLVERVRAGDDYYAAAHEELVANGFGTRSVFNWRTPFYTSTLALLPSRETAQVALAAIALAALALALIWFRREGGPAFGLLAAVALVLNLTAILAPGAVLFAELPAGILILLSASAYGARQPALGFAAGALALFVRELAGLYALVCLWRAWREKRTAEVVAWGVTLVAYAAFFAWHYHKVTAPIGPGDIAYQDGWVAFGGAAFLLATAAFNGVFAIFPAWATALLLPLAGIGLVAWRGEGSARAAGAVAVYLAAFAVIGKPFNDYWGLLYTPLLMLALPWTVAAFRDIAERVRPETGNT